MKKETAILLLHCPDKQGIVASVTDFLFNNNGNIISLEQHLESLSDRFFMRVEWSLENFGIEREKIAEFFETLVANKFNMEWKLAFNDFVPKVALFVSKYSHCFFDILSRYESGEWKIEIPLIISNHEKFQHVADRYKIPYYYVPKNKENKIEAEKRELGLMKEFNIDFIILARYMQVLSINFVSHYPNEIINIHHSSLPAFPGAKPYDSAYKRGVKFVGATAHYVTEDLDAGPIIAQEVIKVSHSDNIKNLKRKGKNTEKIALAKAVWAHMNHKILPFQNKTIVFHSNT